MTYTRDEVANEMRISRYTLYRYLKKLNVKITPYYRINIEELIRIKEALGFSLNATEKEYKQKYA